MRALRALRCGLLSGLLAAAVCRAEEAKPRVLSPGPKAGSVAEALAELLPEEHLTRARLDDVMSCRIWTNYLASLDFDRMYFLQTDIDAFRQHERRLGDELRAGDVRFAYDVFEVFKQRVRERTAYVEQLLDKGFDLDQKETYAWKRKDAPWAKDAAEASELWRKRLKNEFVARIVSRELAAQEKKAPEVEKTAAQKDAEALAAEENRLAPAEFLRKSYRGYRTILDDTDSEFVLEKYMTALASAYDPHSAYMSPASAEDFDIEMGLSLVGIGALLRAEDGAAKIVHVIPGSPADRDKRPIRLRPGDKIIAVGQDKEPLVDILHWPLTKVVRLIRGQKGSRVVLTVVPSSDPTGSTTKTVDLLRDEVQLEEQAAKSQTHEAAGADGVKRKFGVIDLPAFYVDLRAKSAQAEDFRSSTKDVDDLLKSLKTNGVEGVILDLRNNGGGSLPEAVSMTGLFIDKGPVVQVKERFGITRLADDNDYVAYDGPLVVLVNRLSASASEILAGALQDYGRAVIVGDKRTHGKGTVQSVTNLDSDKTLGSVKITSWLFFRVSGASTQMKGVTSDIVLSSPLDFMEFGEEFLPYALPWSQVKPARYAAAGDLGGVIPQLRSQSDARRATDARFAAYGKMLDRIREVNETKEWPLDLASRRKLAKAEKELADMQEELMPDAAEGGKKKDGDLVLEEGLKILADLVAASKKAPAKAAPAPTAGPEGQPAGAPAGRAGTSILHLTLPLCLAVLVIGLPAWMARRRHEP